MALPLFALGFYFYIDENKTVCNSTLYLDVSIDIMDIMSLYYGQWAPGQNTDGQNTDGQNTDGQNTDGKISGGTKKLNLSIFAQFVL